MTDQWDFVLAAYAATAVLTLLVALESWRAMRRSEAAAAASRRDGR